MSDLCLQGTASYFNSFQRLFYSLSPYNAFHLSSVYSLKVMLGKRKYLSICQQILEGACIVIVAYRHL